jgi:hypothetical protein
MTIEFQKNNNFKDPGIIHSNYDYFKIQSMTSTYSDDYSYTSVQKEIYSPPHQEQEQSTLGKIFLNKYVAHSENRGIVSDALLKIRLLTNKNQFNQAYKVLKAIQEIINILHESAFDLSAIPHLKAFIIEDDNSVLIEWIFNDFRIGFNIEDNIHESGWYLMTNGKFGDISASGYIKNSNIKKNIMWLITFILINS